MPLSQRVSAALACLAVVLHLFLAPLSGALAAEDKRALGLGGHCETAMQMAEHAQPQSSPLALFGSIEEPTQQSDDADFSAKCCCGASAVSLASLLVSACHAPTPPTALSEAYPNTAHAWLLPPTHWPTLNPRAPPLI